MSELYKHTSKTFSDEDSIKKQAFAQKQLEEQSEFFHAAVSRWLSQPGITIACGRWVDGAISELMPAGEATLLPGIYDGCFAGVRELRLTGQAHHLHIDFGRVHKLSYAVSPSVCLAFRPSFELRLLILGPGGAPTDRWVVSLMLESPYENGVLNSAAAVNYFQHVALDAAQQPELVELNIDAVVRNSAVANDLISAMRTASRRQDLTGWDDLINALAPLKAACRPALTTPLIALLSEALDLQDASLVIFRDKTLIEFKTERLCGMYRYEEAGHVSWQIGEQNDHHCHLSLDSVASVLFSAEPVSCQGGGLNYTIWFLTTGPCGNPYRRNGYFSITLNRPYVGNRPRLEVIKPLLNIYRKHQALNFVMADEVFLSVLEQGPPCRHPLENADHA
jgi:hypothetical protein